MWISRKIYDDLQLELVKAREEARAVTNASRALETSLDWLRVRVTQMEKERAAMIFSAYGVKIPVPEIHKAPDPFENHPFNETLSFESLSDAEAERQGIGWHADGSVNYTEVKKQ